MVAINMLMFAGACAPPDITPAINRQAVEPGKNKEDQMSRLVAHLGFLHEAMAI